MNTTFQAYLKGSVEAVKVYCEAFSAELGYNYKNDDGTFLHANLMIGDNRFLAVAEHECTKGMNMQFWITFDDEHSLNRACNVLKKGAEILTPLGECPWCKSMADIIDKFGVRWCLNIF